MQNEFDSGHFVQVMAKFGTDFQTMQKLMPGRTRSQLKGKYRRECKLDPERVDLALKGQVSGWMILFNISAFPRLMIKYQVSGSRLCSVGKPHHCNRLDVVLLLRSGDGPLLPIPWIEASAWLDEPPATF